MNRTEYSTQSTILIETLPLDIWQLILHKENFDFTIQHLTYFILYLTSKKIQCILSHCLKTYKYKYINEFSVVKIWSQSKYMIYPDMFLYYSVYNGYLDIMKWFFYNNTDNESKYQYFYTYYHAAIINHHIDVFKWLYLDDNHHIITNVNNKYLYNNMKESAFLDAARHGLLEIMEMIKNREGLVFLLKIGESQIMISAVKSGDISVVQWCITNIDNILHRIYIKSVILQTSVSIKYDIKALSMLKYLIQCTEKDFVLTYDNVIELMRYSLIANNMNTFKWIYNNFINKSNCLHDNNIKLLYDLMEYMTIYSIKWLLKEYIMHNDMLYIKKWLPSMAKNKKYDEFKWLLENGYGSDIINIDNYEESFIPEICMYLYDDDRLDLIELLLSIDIYKEHIIKHNKIVNEIIINNITSTDDLRKLKLIKLLIEHVNYHLTPNDIIRILDYSDIEYIKRILDINQFDKSLLEQYIKNNL